MRQSGWGIVAVSGVWLSLPADAQTNYSQVSCRNADAVKAISLCTSTIQSGEVSGEFLAAAYNDRGDAYANRFDYEHAVADYDRAIKLKPDFARAFGGRGLAHANLQNFEMAIKDYDQAISLDPQYARAFYGRGLAKFGLSDPDGADDDIAKARALDANVGKLATGMRRRGRIPAPAARLQSMPSDSR